MIIFFDGVCNLCHSSVLYLIKSDKKKILKFSSLQSDYAKGLLPKSELVCIESIIFFNDNKLYKKSTAILKLAKILGGWHNILLIGYCIPACLRDKLYDVVAKNRYKWFGKKDKCMVPTKELRKRFLTSQKD
tara:strand:+ start:78496 stop:78891 length:396 start_codon:yes stop_codon:yes gene_type:complete